MQVLKAVKGTLAALSASKHGPRLLLFLLLLLKGSTCVRHCCMMYCARQCVCYRSHALRSGYAPTGALHDPRKITSGHTGASTAEALRRVTYV